MAMAVMVLSSNRNIYHYILLNSSRKLISGKKKSYFEL